MKLTRWLGAAAVALCAAASGRGAVAAGGVGESAKLGAAVSVPPLRGLVAPLIEAAAGEASARPVMVLIPPGRSEHGYEIPPSALKELGSANLVVIVGLGLEPQVEKFLASHEPAPGQVRRVVRFADVAGIAASAEEHEHHEHESGDEHACSHAVDPHLWLDPVMVERLVDAVTTNVAELVAADATAVARVKAAGEKVRERVRAVHESYALACGGFAGKTIVVGHDAWQRLAARYGLETVAIAGLAATEPTPGALDRAKRAVQEKGLKVVFVEPQLSDRAGRRIAEWTGAEVRQLDPLGDGDWFGMMESNLRELKRALGPAKPADVSK